MFLGRNSDIANILSEESIPIFEEVLLSSSKYPTVLFLGSGISKEANYPLWTELLEYFEKEIHEKEGNQDFQLDNVKGGIKEKATAIKVRLDAEFKPLLIDRFTNKPKFKVRDFASEHSYLIDIPIINCYITTNYDVCLEQAARIPEDSWFPPKTLNPKSLFGLEATSIFHIHGVIHPKKPESVDSVIFDSDDYDKVYDPKHDLHNFLVNLFLNFNVVFFGFSMSDDDIQKIIDYVKEKIEYNDLVAKDYRLETISKKQHYIFLSEGELRGKEYLKEFLDKNGIKLIVFKETNYCEIEIIAKELSNDLSAPRIDADPVSALLEKKNE